jgi:putative transposase
MLQDPASASPSVGRVASPARAAPHNATARRSPKTTRPCASVYARFTREALAIEVDRTINAEEAVAILERLAAERGAPANIRSDNGPELTAAVLREWCQRRSTGTAYIEPGSPWQNAYVEPFNSRLRDELLNVEVLTSLAEAQALAADWRTDYNANHPHSALGMMSPATRTSQSTPDSHSGWTDERG